MVTVCKHNNIPSCPECEADPDPNTLTIMTAQCRQPWRVPYGENKWWVMNDEGRLKHCLAHAQKTLGKIAGIIEALDHTDKQWLSDEACDDIGDLAADLVSVALQLGTTVSRSIAHALIRRLDHAMGLKVERDALKARVAELELDARMAANAALHPGASVGVLERGKKAAQRILDRFPTIQTSPIPAVAQRSEEGCPTPWCVYPGGHNGPCASGNAKACVYGDCPRVAGREGYCPEHWEQKATDAAAAGAPEEAKAWYVVEGYDGSYSTCRTEAEARGLLLHASALSFVTTTRPAPSPPAEAKPCCCWPYNSKGEYEHDWTCPSSDAYVEPAAPAEAKPAEASDLTPTELDVMRGLAENTLKLVAKLERGAK